MSKPRDIQAFLSSYPSIRPNPALSANLEFYSNKRKMKPDNVTYDEFINVNERNYDELEYNHGYIQWLFPIREHGVNPSAQPLELHEIQAMQQDPVVLNRIMRSYKMMLGFYGIDFNDGVLKPAADHRARLTNLRNNSHNLLRLSRIIKHLSEFPSLQPHAAPLVLYFVALHSEGLLDFSSGTMRGGSLDKWWCECFRDDKERDEVKRIVRTRGEYGAGKWGWKEYDKWLGGRKKGYTGE